MSGVGLLGVSAAVKPFEVGAAQIHAPPRLPTQLVADAWSAGVSGGFSPPGATPIGEWVGLTLPYCRRFWSAESDASGPVTVVPSPRRHSEISTEFVVPSVTSAFQYNSQLS